MKVEIAFNPDKAVGYTFQDEFPKTTKCCHCGKEARLGFVAHETEEKSIQMGGKYVCGLYDNDPDGAGFWFHDACCVAVYFCKGCFKATAIHNQA